MITSSANNVYKELLKIKRKKEKSGYVLLEGLRNLEQAKANELKFEVYTCDEGNYPEAICFSRELFAMLTDTVHPQDVLIKIEAKANQTFLEGPIVILDRIQDPGNLGTIFRTAEAFGIQNIGLMKGTVSPYNSKVLRSSLSAIFNLRIQENLVLEDVKMLNRPIYAATLDGVSHREVVVQTNFCLILGNEANGICKELINLSDYQVSIPMNSFMQSLNVAIAGGILLESFAHRMVE